MKALYVLIFLLASGSAFGDFRQGGGGGWGHAHDCAGSNDPDCKPHSHCIASDYAARYAAEKRAQEYVVQHINAFGIKVNFSEFVEIIRLKTEEVLQEMTRKDLMMFLTEEDNTMIIQLDSPDQECVVWWNKKSK